ncbi:unnamed protein product, partial [Effrenium voratum]
VQKALDIAVEPQISYVLGLDRLRRIDFGPSGELEDLAAVRPLLPSLRANGQGRRAAERIAQKLEKRPGTGS